MEKVKKTKNKSKFILILVALIIIIGIAITATMGLNVSLKYQSSQKIEIYLAKEFEISDVRKIVNEIMPGADAIIQKVEVFEDTVAITAKEISDENKQNIITKINEKFATEIKAENIEISNIPAEKEIDIAKTYAIPIGIVTVAILIYMAIRYAKLGAIKVVLKTILVLIVTELMLLSVMAITRIPVCEFTMPAAMALYVLTLLVVTSTFENKLEEKTKLEENN